MKISVVLEALTGSFETDMNRAAKTAEKRMKDIERTAISVGKAMGAGLVVGVTALGVIVKKSIDAADEMSKLAQTTGVTTEALSQLQYAAGLSGVEDLGTSLVKFNKAIAEAGAGSKSQAEAFAAIGVSVTDANGNLKDTETVLMETAEAFSHFEDGAGKTAVAMDLFGKSGAAMIPLLNEGAAGIAEMRKEADDLGLTLDARTGKAAEQFNDNLSRMGSLVSGIGNQITRELAQPLADVTDGFISAAREGGTLKGIFREIAPVAQSAAIGTAVFAESVYGLMKALRAVGGSFEAVWADIELFAAFVARGGPAGLAFEGNRKALAKALEDRNATVAEANKRYVDLWNYNGTALSDALRVQFGHVSDVKQITKDMIDAATGLGTFNMFPQQDVQIPFAPGGGKPKPQVSYGEQEDSGNPKSSKAAKEAKEVTSALDQQVQALIKQSQTVGLSERQMALWEATQAGAGSAAKDFINVLYDQIEADEAKIKNQQELDDLMQQYANQLDGVSAEQAAFNSQFEDAERLFNSGALGEGADAWEKYNRIVSDAQDKLDGAKDAADKASSAIDEFNRELARDVQNELADSLYAVFDGGLKGIEKRWGQMIQKLLADAAAAQLGKALFGDMSGGAGSGGGGGLFQQGIAAIGSYFGFGGAKASGGPVSSGSAYLVGEQGPEMFVPKMSGTIIPNHAMSKSEVNNYFTIQAPTGSVSRSTQMQIAAAAARGAATANSRNN